MPVYDWPSTLHHSVCHEDISTDMFGKATNCVHECLYSLPATSAPQLLIPPSSYFIGCGFPISP